MPSLADDPEVLARFQANADVAERIAWQLARMSGAFGEREDLASAAREGLLDAARRYDPERGVPFRSYAALRARGAAIDAMRQMAHLPRRVHERLRGLDAGNRHLEGVAEETPAAAVPGATTASADAALAEHLAGMATAMALGMVAEPSHAGSTDLKGDSAFGDPEENVRLAELGVLLRQAVAELPDPEQTLIRRHYFEGERFDHVSAALGLSKSWGSRLHKRAMARLTERLRRA